MLVGENELKRVKEGEIIQLQRKGFFRCDVPYAPLSDFTSRVRPLILFHIPDGHATTPPISASSNLTTDNKKTSKSSSNAVSIIFIINFPLYFKRIIFKMAARRHYSNFNMVVKLIFFF